MIHIACTHEVLILCSLFLSLAYTNACDLMLGHKFRFQFPEIIWLRVPESWQGLSSGELQQAHAQERKTTNCAPKHTVDPPVPRVLNIIVVYCLHIPNAYLIFVTPITQGIPSKQPSLPASQRTGFLKVHLDDDAWDQRFVWAAWKTTKLWASVCGLYFKNVLFRRLLLNEEHFLWLYLPQSAVHSHKKLETYLPK